eukprot:gene10772-11972_t
MRLLLLTALICLTFTTLHSFPQLKDRKRSSLSLSLAGGAKIAAVVSVGALAFWNLLSAPQQFETAADIPREYYRNKESIHGLVVKVVDGDTMRVRHLGKRDFTGSLQDHTIMVRLAAVDAPETAKKGNPGQPFAEDAKAFARDRLEGKEVDVKLLATDQYSRAIGRVQYKASNGLFGLFSQTRDIGEDLLSEGLAVVYRQGGAQYDGDRNHWLALESKAQKERKGMWYHGTENVDLPSDYKKKVKSQERQPNLVPAY